MHSPTAQNTLPLIPAAALKQHRVHEPNDTRFRAAARLLQALWREAQRLPLGSVVRRDGSSRRLGSRLSIAAAAAGRNFLTPAIAAWARHQLAYRQNGALIDERRLFGNLLTSMSLAVNLFAPLALDRQLAARLLRSLIPDLPLVRIADVILEYSPGRLDADLTADRTAFDVAVIYDRPDGRRGLVAIEVKYSEAMTDNAPIADATLLIELARSSGLFKNPDHGFLRVNPLQQLFREHLLAHAAVARRDFASAHFLLVAPAHNHLVQRASGQYAAQLKDACGGSVPFLSIELEQMIEAFTWQGEADYAWALHDRYLAWDKLHRIVSAALTAQQTKWAPIAPVGPAVRRLERAA
ncbi:MULTISPECIES: hypothetical protein [unclassified Sphingomonas]|uniref:PGN_0703 family putative restriction endonuclease n=1 Tax=unclassified Sphingomonas TaxID=196159 RepID=UPI00226A964E|nr:MULTISPECIES: hypothetical protein [unclassified Sphingomonas]